MTTTDNFKDLINNESTPVALGELVRSSGNNGFVRAKADLSADVDGFLGVNGSTIVYPTGLGQIFSSGGDVDVLLEPGLSPSAGQRVYVSAATAGRGTNVPPQVVVGVGTIEDASAYSLTGLVTCALDVDVSRADATWPLPASFAVPNLRYFALDGALGDDSRSGFSDVSSLAAGAAAVKTAARLAQVLPRDGRGMAAMLFVRSFNYAELTSFLMGLRGYYYFLARATCDDATAGSVAFADDANDRSMNGYVTATGMNPAGYNPAGTPTTQSMQLLKVGGGSPGFPPEVPISLPGGARLRFGIAAPTQAALRGLRRSIVKVEGSDKITWDRPLPVAPLPTDVVYIEMPGAMFLAVEGSCDGLAPASLGGSYQLSGFHAVGSVNGANRISMIGSWLLAGCWYDGANSSALRGPGWVSLNSYYVRPDGTSFDTGGCCRSNGNFGVSTTGMFNQVFGGTGPYAGSIALSRTGRGEIENSFVAVSGLSYGLLSGTAQDGSNSDPDCVGNNTLVASRGNFPCRILGSGQLGGLQLEADATICQLDVTGCGAKPGFVVRGVGLHASIVGPLTGATGNNDVGLDLVHAQGCTIFLPSVPTLTGALGDVRLGDGTIMSWADLDGGFVDASGNRFIGAAGPTGTLSFSGVFNGDVAAALSYFADAGFAAASNNPNALHRPTSNRLVKVLRAYLSCSTFTTDVTVELYKNGSATGQKVVYAVGETGAKLDGAHPVILRSTDTYDVRVSNAGADPGTAGNVAGMLEYAV